MNIISPRPANIGAMDIKRLLPVRQKRMVGPFIFLDYMHATLEPQKNADVAPHPHIGLSTLTWLLKGELMHRDSLGSEQAIKPGEVNWMTAGSGIVHSERIPAGHNFEQLEGLQFWVALPKEKELMAPEFQHISAQQLPQWEQEGAQFTLIAGEWNGHQSPLLEHWPTLLVDVKCQQEGMLDLDFDSGPDSDNELAIMLVSGTVRIDDEPLPEHHLFHSDQPFKIHYSVDSHFVIFGGKKFSDTPKIYWNFVAHSPELIEQAKERWQKQEFDKVAGETEFVPLP